MMGRDRITKYACMIFFNGLQDLIGGQKVNISCFSDESCILDVTWEVVYCSKRYLLSIHSQHDGSEGGDGIGGTCTRHERIEGDDRNMP